MPYREGSVGNYIVKAQLGRNGRPGSFYICLPFSIIQWPRQLFDVIRPAIKKERHDLQRTAARFGGCLSIQEKTERVAKSMEFMQNCRGAVGGT